MAERWLAMHASNASRYPRASQDSQVAGGAEPEEHRTPPSVRRSAAVRASALETLSELSPGRSDRGFRSRGNERLYEAYNDLHALAQDFEKPFDAPAILVVGHQTDGKSGRPQRLQRPGPGGWRDAEQGGGLPRLVPPPATRCAHAQPTAPAHTSNRRRPPAAQLWSRR